MTIREAIETADSLRPNAYSTEQKVQWLSVLDGQIQKEILSTHEGWAGATGAYTPQTDPDQQLLLPQPYAAEIYRFWLESRIDLANGELSRYNSSITLFNNAYLTFQDWYNRTHRPLRRVARFRYY